LNHNFNNININNKIILINSKIYKIFIKFIIFNIYKKKN
jgi:hypothetical protein